MIKTIGTATLGAMILSLSSFAPASAKSIWQKPQAKQCELKPGSDCNLEASCPAKTPYIVSGGGGIPSVEPSEHSLAMTMNLPINDNTWRVRWRNLSSDHSSKAKVVVRIKCSDDASEAGW